ncbi:hypothetical protein AB1K84_13370 [Mesobacillus foraminis]
MKTKIGKDLARKGLHRAVKTRIREESTRKGLHRADKGQNPRIAY